MSLHPRSISPFSWLLGESNHRAPLFYIRNNPKLVKENPYSLHTVSNKSSSNDELKFAIVYAINHKIAHKPSVLAPVELFLMASAHEVLAAIWLYSSFFYKERRKLQVMWENQYVVAHDFPYSIYAHKDENSRFTDVRNFVTTVDTVGLKLRAI